MRKLEFVVCAVLAALPAVGGEAEAGKDEPLAIPAEYARLRAEDWPVMRACLDDFLLRGLVDPGTAPSGVRTNDVVWTLRRLAKITWPEAQRGAVAAHLAGWIETLLLEKGMLRRGMEVSRADVPYHSHFFYVPHQALRTLCAIDPPQAYTSFRRLWTLIAGKPENWYCASLRTSMLELLSAQFRDEAAQECLQALERISGTRLTPEERRLRDQFTRRRTLLGLNDQRKAFAYLWEEDKVEGPAVTRERAWIWYEKLKDMQEVYGTLDPAVPFGMATAAEAEFAKRYILLYASCGAANRKFSSAEKSPDARSRAFMASIVKTVEAFYAEHPEEIRRLRSSGDDFLRSAADGVKRNLLAARLGTQIEHKGGELKGVRLLGVTPGGPAEKAGLQMDDLVVELAGKKTGSLDAYAGAVETLEADTPAPVVVERAGMRMTLTIVVSAAQE